MTVPPLLDVLKTTFLRLVQAMAFAAEGQGRMFLSQPGFHGLGDAFAAAFLAAELAGKPAPDCLKAGIVAGAEAVTRIGAQPTTR